MQVLRQDPSQKLAQQGRQDCLQVYASCFRHRTSGSLSEICSATVGPLRRAHDDSKLSSAWSSFYGRQPVLWQPRASVGSSSISSKLLVGSGQLSTITFASSTVLLAERSWPVVGELSRAPASGATVCSFAGRVVRRALDCGFVQVLHECSCCRLSLHQSANHS